MIKGFVDRKGVEFFFSFLEDNKMSKFMHSIKKFVSSLTLTTESKSFHHLNTIKYPLMFVVIIDESK